MITFLDFETTFQTDEKKRTDPSPYINTNYLVSAGYFIEPEYHYGDPEYNVHIEYDFYRHNDLVGSADSSRLQKVLDNTTLLVAHNCKFELSWLKACNFKYSGKVACTQIREYVLAKGMKLGVSLEESCERNYLANKKSDLTREYLRQDIGFEAIPWETVQEYGKQDVVSLRELFYNQLKRLEDNNHLWPTIEMMEEFCQCLTEIEENGIKIDVDELDRLEKEYRLTLNTYTNDLQKIVEDVMGDTPINLDSPEQLSMLIYSRKVKDKKSWKKLFNLGSEIRGSIRKPKHPKRYSKKDFIEIVRTHCEVLHKTQASNCESCIGTGYIQRSKVDGTPWKKISKCPTCQGNGYIYKQLSEIAGLRRGPDGYEDAAVGGFATDKETLHKLREHTKPGSQAHEFLTKITELSKISNYVDTVIAGIRRGLRSTTIEGQIGFILHTQFMQCITATGRLSGKNPNFQNIPRGSTFPIKKAIISRFSNGQIISSDAKQLEFRIAAELSGDSQMIADILAGIDVHAVTATYTLLSRQDSKPYTFAPVYGATSKGKPEHIANYFIHFKEKYCEHDKWKIKTANQIIADGGFYTIPSGREYYFPNTVRYANGGISNSTIIANYPVQGFATADIMPVYCILMWRLMSAHINADGSKMRSKIILEVHDDVTVDTHPDEVHAVLRLFRTAERQLVDECYRRWNYRIQIPLEFEIKGGPNWLEQKDYKDV